MESNLFINTSLPGGVKDLPDDEKKLTNDELMNPLLSGSIGLIQMTNCFEMA